MKKFIVILASILMMSTISGCWSYHELRDYAIVMGIGIDKGSTENIKVTAQIALASKIKSNSKDGGDGGEAKAYWNIESEGETIFKVFRDFTHQSGRKLYLPHNKVAIFSREIAEEGIRPYL
ncbi:MAG: Ger(x)C family spore germination protein, partial [Oscillospiraceae bacterium]